MHNKFREYLSEATGQSEFIIAINLDIRGFSVFSKEVESPDLAMFIKRVYMRLIDDYFPNASFFKPTGDGLLIIVPYTETSLKQTARTTVSSCMKAIRNFKSFCRKDPMINFKVPDKIGIGLSRGTACRLFSGDITLDYSGRVLNLASRLMDVARPSGIVFDADFDMGLLTKTQQSLFDKTKIFLKSFAEEESQRIYYTKELTQIADSFKYPIIETEWETKKDRKTIKELITQGPLFIHWLDSKPRSKDEISVVIQYPTVKKGKRIPSVRDNWECKHFEYEERAGKPYVTLNYDKIVKYLQSESIKQGWPIDIIITYPKRGSKK